MGRDSRAAARGVLVAVVSIVTLTTAVAASVPAASAGTPALRAPKTTPAEDNTYLADAAKADSTLATYVQQHGNVALRAMLTDGTAFCAFLQRGGGIDTAIVDTAVGAKSVESATHLPTGVTTFNTLEAVALLELCPSEQRLVPVAVRVRLHKLKALLGSPAVG